MRAVGFVLLYLLPYVLAEYGEESFSLNSTDVSSNETSSEVEHFSDGTTVSDADVENEEENKTDHFDLTMRRGARDSISITEGGSNEDKSDCDNTELLKNVLSEVIPLLRNGVSEKKRTAGTLKVLKDVLEANSNVEFDPEITIKLNDLIKSLDENNIPIEIPVKDSLRNKKPDRKSHEVKMHIHFKYDMPIFDNPRCTTTLVNIFKNVHDSIDNLIADPICESAILKQPLSDQVIVRPIDNIVSSLTPKPLVQNMDYNTLVDNNGNPLRDIEKIYSISKNNDNDQHSLPDYLSLIDNSTDFTSTDEKTMLDEKLDLNSNANDRYLQRENDYEQTNDPDQLVFNPKNVEKLSFYPKIPNNYVEQTNIEQSNPYILEEDSLAKPVYLPIQENPSMPANQIVNDSIEFYSPNQNNLSPQLDINDPYPSLPYFDASVATSDDVSDVSSNNNGEVYPKSDSLGYLVSAPTKPTANAYDPIVEPVPPSITDLNEINSSNQQFAPNPTNTENTLPQSLLPQEPILRVINENVDNIILRNSELQSDVFVLGQVSKLKSAINQPYISDADYENIVKEYGLLIEYIKLLRLQNDQLNPLYENIDGLFKNKKQKTNNELEFTYLVKRPQPLVYQPYYYVKYRVPYISFLKNLKTIIDEKPHLRTSPKELLKELIPKLKVIDMSSDLKSYDHHEITKLADNGTLISTKVLTDNNTDSEVVEKTLALLKNLNSEISVDDIAGLLQQIQAEGLQQEHNAVDFLPRIPENISKHRNHGKSKKSKQRLIVTVRESSPKHKVIRLQKSRNKGKAVKPTIIETNVDTPNKGLSEKQSGTRGIYNLQHLSDVSERSLVPPQYSIYNNYKYHIIPQDSQQRAVFPENSINTNIPVNPYQGNNNYQFQQSLQDKIVDATLEAEQRDRGLLDQKLNADEKQRDELQKYLWTNRYYELFRQNDPYLSSGTGQLKSIIPHEAINAQNYYWKRNRPFQQQQAYYKIPSVTSVDNLGLNTNKVNSLSVGGTSNILNIRNNGAQFGDETANPPIPDLNRNFKNNEYLIHSSGYYPQRSIDSTSTVVRAEDLINQPVSNIGSNSVKIIKLKTNTHDSSLLSRANADASIDNLNLQRVESYSNNPNGYVAYKHTSPQNIYMDRKYKSYKSLLVPEDESNINVNLGRTE